MAVGLAPYVKSGVMTISGLLAKQLGADVGCDRAGRDGGADRGAQDVGDEKCLNNLDFTRFLISFSPWRWKLADMDFTRRDTERLKDGIASINRLRRDSANLPCSGLYILAFLAFLILFVCLVFWIQQRALVVLLCLLEQHQMMNGGS